MRRRYADAARTGYSIADLFAGAMVAILLLLLFFWFHAKVEAEKYREVRELQEIFDGAFSDIEKHEAFEVDGGQLSVKSDFLFDQGRAKLKKGKASTTSIQVRSVLVEALEKLKSDWSALETTEGKKVEDYVDILVVGHADCERFNRPRRTKCLESADCERFSGPEQTKKCRKSCKNYYEANEVADNWELSAMRAVKFAEFLTRPCKKDRREATDADPFRCESKSSANEHDKNEKLEDQRIDGRFWRVVPAGRDARDPRPLPKTIAHRDKISDIFKAVSKESDAVCIDSSFHGLVDKKAVKEAEKAVKEAKDAVKKTKDAVKEAKDAVKEAKRHQRRLEILLVPRLDKLLVGK